MREELQTLQGHEAEVWSVVFSPDGERVATASADKTARVWSLGDMEYIEDILGISCDWVRYYLASNPNLEKSDRTLCDGVPKPKQIASENDTTSNSDTSTSDTSNSDTSTPTPKPSNYDLQAIAEDYYSRKNEPANSQYIENFPNIMAKSPTDAQKANAYINRGVIYYRQKNYSQAIEDYTEAIKLAPNNVAAYINRGMVHTILKEPEKAIEDYNQALEINPENIDAYINRGIAYSSLGNLQQAIEDYDRAIKLAPNNADAYYVKGLTLALQEENKQQAIEAYQKAAELYQQQGKNEDFQRAQNKIKELE